MRAHKSSVFLAVMTAPEQRIPGTAPDDDRVYWRTVASVRDLGASRVAGADHLQFSAFRLGLSARIPQCVADRFDRAAPLRGFVHGRTDRRLERSRLSGGPGQLSPL